MAHQVIENDNLTHLTQKTSPCIASIHPHVLYQYMGMFYTNTWGCFHANQRKAALKPPLINQLTRYFQPTSSAMP